VLDAAVGCGCRMRLSDAAVASDTENHVRVNTL
jgi:hypothetical protein